jgi:hypothetical protein
VGRFFHFLGAGSTIDLTRRGFKNRSFTIYLPSECVNHFGDLREVAFGKHLCFPNVNFWVTIRINHLEPLLKLLSNFFGEFDPGSE